MSLVENERMPGHTMEAVVIYDDIEVASIAITRLHKASRDGGEITQWGLKWWRLDVLNTRPTGRQALVESAGAHLIVLAVHSQSEVPAGVLEWLENWAGRREVQDAAVAVFDGSSQDTLSLSASPELSEFAMRHGLNLIVDEGQSLPDSVRSPSPGLKRLPIDPLLLARRLRAFNAANVIF